MSEISALRGDILTLDRQIRQLRTWQQQLAAGDQYRANAAVGVLPSANVPAHGSIGLWTNQSGGALGTGTVVIQNGDRQFDTTGAADDLDVVGVIVDTAIADTAEGRIRHQGYHPSVIVEGAVVAGQFLRTSTTAGAAEDAGATVTSGTFGMALTAFAGPGAGTVAAYLFGTIGGVSVHANLSGIGGGEDDHPEYLLASGARSLTGSMLITGANELNWRDGALVIYSSADGKLDIDADVEVEITAPAIDLVGTVTTDVINEHTGAAGVTIENVTHRDGSIELHHGVDTIAGDEILAPTGGYIVAAAQAGVADNLDGIGGGADGRIIIVTADAGDTITVNHNDAGGGAGRKILLNQDNPLVLVGNRNDALVLLYDSSLDSGNGAWIEVAKSLRAPGTRAVRASSAQTIADSTLTLAEYDATTFDDDDWWVIGNPGRITVDVPGRYMVTAQFLFVNNVNGSRYSVLRRYNAAHAAQETLGEYIKETDITNPYGLIIGTSEATAAGDYYVQHIWQDSGGNLNTIAAKTHLVVQRLW